MEEGAMSCQLNKLTMNKGLQAYAVLALTLYIAHQRNRY